MTPSGPPRSAVGAGYTHRAGHARASQAAVPVGVLVGRKILLLLVLREPHHLLTGILRCGRVSLDGSLCNTPLRVNSHPHVKSHLYSCPAKSAGGCGGISRRGDLIDEFISEAVLAKLEERAMTARETEPWAGAGELARQREKLAKLRARWDSDEVSDELFFSAVKPLEERIRQLRA